MGRWMNRRWSRLVLVLLLLGPTSPAPAQPREPACDAALAARRQLVADAPGLKVLLLAEFHTSRDDHAWQLATLQALVRRRPRLALGLEMVPAARQGALDRYSAGRTNEAGFLQEVGWNAVWNHDPGLYLPLLRWARAEGVPLLALNVEPAVAQRVRQRGLALVPPSEREGIGPPAPVGPAYRQRLTAAWQGHQTLADPADPAAAADLERFIDSQRLRDRAMAERLAAAQRREPGRLVVALVGRGHLEGDDGVPRQLQALGVAPVAVARRPLLPEGCVPSAAGPRLGVYMESAEGVVLVRQVAPGSAAAAAGIRPGDRVLAVNGEPMERAGQVIRRVAAQPPDEPLRLSLEREGRRLELTVPLAPASRDNGGPSPSAT